MEKIREIDEADAVVIVFPPREVFLNSDQAFWGYPATPKIRYVNYRVLLPDSGGMFFKGNPNEPPYPGCPNPLIVKAVAQVKRLLFTKVQSLKNPLSLLLFRQHKRELLGLIHAELQRYYFKPERYCRSVRESYRVLTKRWPLRDDWSKNYDWVHSFCMFLEFDFPYRIKFQAVMGNMSRELFRIDPYHELLGELKACREEEKDNLKMVQFWSAAIVALRTLWWIPQFRTFLRFFAQEVNIDEMKLTIDDIFHQNKGLKKVAE